MSTAARVAILTRDPDGALGGTRWPEILSRLAAPLEAAGMRVEGPAWTRAGDLKRFDLVLSLLARVDLIRDLGGKPVLMELELIEPDLYLQYDAGAPGRFARAVATAAARTWCANSDPLILSSR